MRCLVTGITGSDGQLLARLLVEEGHEVFGLVRSQKVTSLPYGAIVRGDLADPGSIMSVIQQVRPDEVYNLGAFSHVGWSFNEPHYLGLVNGLGAASVFEAVKRFAPDARVYQASTSEMYGNGPMPADENTPFAPVSPYGVAKLYAHQMAHVYRLQGIWVSCGILFNHVSIHHGQEFLPNKVAHAAAKIRAGRQEGIRLGDLSPQRDWGWAPEYVEGMPRILRHSQPDDFVMATGESCTVRDFCEAVFAEFGLDFMAYYEQDTAQLRPTDISYLQGNVSKARNVLGWESKIFWKDIARKLALHQMEAVPV